MNLFLSEYVAELENTPLEDIQLLYWEPEREHPFSTVLQDLYGMLTKNPILQITDFYKKTVWFSFCCYGLEKYSETWYNGCTLQWLHTIVADKFF